MRILIAEDSKTNQRLMQQLLSVWGQCDTADNGREAVELFDRALGEGAPYQLVCLDVMMPEMDGHEALTELRRIEAGKGITSSARVKVIMTTAVDSSSSMSSAKQNGCDGYLVKPIRKGVLCDELEKLGLIPCEAADGRS